MSVNSQAAGSCLWDRSWYLVFLASFVLVSQFGCQPPRCPGRDAAAGDFDDSTPQDVCATDMVVFSPNTIDPSLAFPAAATPAAAAGAQTAVPYFEIAVSVSVLKDSMEPRSLANLDVCQCGESDNMEEQAQGIALKGEVSALAVGGCKKVSSTRIHCLTDYDGRAGFAIQIEKSAKGSICGDCTGLTSAADGGVGNRVKARLDIHAKNSDGGVAQPADAAPVADGDDMVDAGDAL